MLYRTGKKFKAVVGSDSFDFEVKLNAALDNLNKAGFKYELTFNYNAGFCAYIVWEETLEIPESAKDEYEQIGERHNCIECPYFVRPTDGRRKYTRCRNTQKLTTADCNCCDQFYEELDKGMIKLIEIG